MREYARLLPEGGRLVLLVRNPLFRSADRWPRSRPARILHAGDLRKLVEDAGLTVERLSTLVPDLRLPLFYRGDLSFSLRFERLPWFRKRGRLLFLEAAKPAGGGGRR